MVESREIDILAIDQFAQVVLGFLDRTTRDPDELDLSTPAASPCAL
jgi:hypothetical protein